MAKRGSVTDSAGERLFKVEFTRRKNRRASITEQYVVPLANSRRKENIAQTRHYAFLRQPENLTAVEEIVAHVERLADSEALALGYILSPMDKHRLLCWTTDVRTLVEAFEPSGDRENDPLRQLLELLQGLQEGHACLAEVAIEARQVVEKWERVGIFDDESKSSEEDDDEDDGNASEVDLRSPQQRALDWEREKRRKMEASYVYQCVRERAAARVIKRNTLQWVRSRAAFCNRVAELEVFGNTTAALVEELTTVSDLQRRTAVCSSSNHNDVFDLMRGKRQRTGGLQIDFSDLMLFAKHLALFTVDHAMRRVDEIDHKRRLFQLRCLIKLQTWWRKMHVIVKGRRMVKLLEEMKRKKEEERVTELLLQQQDMTRPKVASAKNTTDTSSSGKVGKVGGKSGKTADSAGGVGTNFGGGTSSSHSVSSPKTETGDASARPLTSIKAASRVAKDARAMMPTPPSTPKTSSIASGGGGASKPKRQSLVGGAANKDDKLERMSRAARTRQSRLRKEFEEEIKRREREDDEAARDTGDVETAWQRFIESAAKNAGDDERAWDGDGDAEHERRSTPGSVAATRSRGATPFTRDDGEGEEEEWREWSDDDQDHDMLSDPSSRGTTPSSSSAVSSRLSTPRSNGSRPLSNATSRADALHRPMPPTKAVVAVMKRSPPVRTPQTPMAPEIEKDGEARQATSPADGLELPYAAAARRQLLFGTSQSRQLRPALPGTGQLSKFMPFAELPKEPPRVLTPPSATVAPVATPRRHLHEFDFGLPQTADSNATFDMILLTQPLVEELHFVAPDPNSTMIAATPSTTHVRVFSSVRANRVARIRAALEAKDAGQPEEPAKKEPPKAEKKTPSTQEDYATESSAPSRATSPEPFVFVNTDVRNALLRPIRGRPSMVDAYISNPMLKLDFRREDVVRKSEDPRATKEDAVITEETVATMDSPSAAPNENAKVGSHTDWLRSMGLENAAAMAVRSVNVKHPPSGRSVKTKTASIHHQGLAASVLTMEEASAKRARRKRKQEHALPLLGRHLPEKKKPIQQALKTAPVEEEGESHLLLPPMAEHDTRTATPPRQQYRHIRVQDRKQAIHKAKDLRQIPTKLVSDSASERSFDSSEYTGDDDDDALSHESDTSADDASDAPSDASERKDHDSVAESVFEERENDGESIAQDAREDLTTAASGSSPKTSRRRRHSVRESNQRRRSSLHEPRSTRERQQTKKKPTRQARRRTEKQKQSLSDLMDPVTDRHDRSTIPTPEKKRRSRFKPHVSSLFRRLVTKKPRGATDWPDSAEVEDVDGEDDFGESDASGEGDESPDPERAAAFFKLYSQYLGLLSAAPTLGV